MITVLNDQNFEQEVLKSDKPVLVDFWTAWCPPCKIMEPFVEKLSEEYDDRIKVCKLNVDEARQTGAAYGIEAIPTIMIFRQGEVVGNIIGAVPYEILVQKVQEYI
ncbi:thioredoxin [Candidatus Parcubacteria bacterium]|jgi:thioredoxin 1|nr:thioredoxin [Candidatus Parcubacteria bacterium]